MSVQSRTGFAYYEQNLLLPAPATLASTGIVTATRVHFSQPIDIVHLLMLSSTTQNTAANAIRWDVVSVIGGSTVVRSSQQLVVATTVAAANPGVGIYCDLEDPLRVDPGEEVVMNVIVNRAAETAYVGFLYRAYGFAGPAFVFDQYGNAPENRISDMTEVTAA